MNGMCCTCLKLWTMIIGKTVEVWCSDISGIHSFVKIASWKPESFLIDLVFVGPAHQGLLHMTYFTHFFSSYFLR